MQFIWQAWAKEKKKEETKKSRVENEKSWKTQKGSGISEVSPCIPAGIAWELQRPLYGLNTVAGTPQQNDFFEASKRMTLDKILNWWSSVSTEPGHKTLKAWEWRWTRFWTDGAVCQRQHKVPAAACCPALLISAACSLLGWLQELSVKDRPICD